MIYRFAARQAGSQDTIELQLQAPAGEPVDKVTQELRTSLSQQALAIDSLQYIGSIETDFQGLVVPAKEKCATPGCQNTVDTAGEHCEKCRTVTLCGWYTPSGKAQSGNKCVVVECHRDATFHLCKRHAIPGMIVENEGGSFVTSFWLVERAGQMRLITLNDYALGDLFGGQQEFEHWLSVQGYKVHGLISSGEELKSTKQLYPGLRITSWSPNLPGGENDLPES